jgi:hypothetical protein
MSTSQRKNSARPTLKVNEEKHKAIGAIITSRALSKKLFLKNFFIEINRTLPVLSVYQDSNFDFW